MSISYHTQLQQIITTLQQHPNVRLTHFTQCSPASYHQIESLEKKLGVKLEDSIQSFYQTANGFQVRWHYVNDNVEEDLPNGDYLDYKKYKKPRGCINILPLQQIEQGLNNDQEAFSKAFCLIDQFDEYNSMSLCLEGKRFSNMVMNDGYDYTKSYKINFGAYIDFLALTFGQISSRLHFFEMQNGFQKPLLTLPNSFKEKYTGILLDQISKRKQFQNAEQLGSNHLNIKTGMMQQLAKNSELITTGNISKIEKDHLRFLEIGGAGGKWKLLSANGLVIGIYSIDGEQIQGKQATFDLKNLEKSSFEKAILPFANFSGAFAQNASFKEADLTGSLFTDGFFENANFEAAFVEKVDFSRANLKGVSFKNAVLTGSDFENCDLTNADFTNAKLDNCSFQGAILKGVKY